MRKLKLIALKICILVLRFIYFFMKLLPQKKKVVLISRQSDKPSTDFLLIKKKFAEERPDYEAVILSRTLTGGKKSAVLGMISYAFHMLTQMMHLATSKIVFLDSYCIAVSVLKHKPSLKVIQIWHATGSMKKFGYAMIGQEEGSSAEIAEAMRMHKNYDHALISSMSFAKDYIEGFGIGKELIEEIPLPKVDLLTDKSYKAEMKEKVLEKYPSIDQSKKTIIYCPTFRKNEDNIRLYVEALMDAVDYDKYNLIYAPHPNSKLKIENKHVIRYSGETFEALCASDYVISDYSSVIYEAGLLELPIFLYAYDWEEYSEKRSFNLDLAEDVPTIFTGNVDKIMDHIINDRFDRETFKVFIDDNVKVPPEGCINRLMELVGCYI